MTPYPFALIVILSALLGTSCANEQRRPEAHDITDTLQWIPYRLVHREAATISVASSADSVTIDIAGITVTDTTEPGKLVQDSIDAVLLGNSFITEQVPPNAQAFVDSLVAEYRKFTTDFPDTPGGWTVERSANILRNTPSLLVVTVQSYENVGGAHPNHFERYLCFSPSTGHPLTLDSVLTGTYTPTLIAEAERMFRSEREITKESSLSDAGWMFPDDKFTLAVNWMPNRDGIVFHYNTYEVGPYVMGTTTITVPYKALKQYLRPGWPR